MRSDALALFDLDGTITHRDTFLDFMIHARGWPPVAGAYLRHAPRVGLYALGAADNGDTKFAVFRSAWRGRTPEDYLRAASAYARSRLGALVRPEALRRIRWHQARGHRLAVVSASMREWIDPWAREEGIETVIANEFQLRGADPFALRAPNCWGERKLERVVETFGDLGRFEVFAYGDSAGDRALLRAADHGWYRSFPGE